ncbi:SprB repeat-containing protein, partial [Tenacibaculum sp. 1_MG-2023]|uniref:SprB repeat-containing protein n=1 Tax=Tenacibaculum sp. 1_MG-2023 TaxID=3062653 RepID=UPI0026E1958F
ATLTPTHVLCFEATTGGLDLSVSGGNGGYTFEWNDTANSTTEDLSGLSAGTYDVTITDSKGCEFTISGTITEPTEILLTMSSTDEDGPTTGDGTASVSATGGAGTYTYLWNTGATTSSIANLSAGTYTVTVTDVNGCEQESSVIVNSGSCLDLGVSLETVPVTCNGDEDGSITATVTGGSGNFTYSWSTGQTIKDITSLSGGSYTITVTDTVTECSEQATITVA